MKNKLVDQTLIKVTCIAYTGKIFKFKNVLKAVIHVLF